VAQPTVLIVDDEPDIRELLSMTLEGMDFARHGRRPRPRRARKLQTEDYHFCLTDMRLPDGDGLELVQWMQRNVPGVPVAVITAHGNVETAVRALKLGAYDFVSKPVKIKDLRKLVATALKLRGVQRREPAQRARGRSCSATRRPWTSVRAMISKVARSQAPVHIVGESGTGKELVARLIHDSGPRAGMPFVPVNCGAIPSELMESELFGHLKGSFTGATADKEGLLRSAEGGTVLLDEIADLPLQMQVKLLRVIQERAVRPVGDTREIPVDVRFVSATHQDLGQLVADGRFREDLYYRINVIELQVPPLRERGDDMVELAEHILARLAPRMGIETPVLSAEARRLLLKHAFPGNVRELEKRSSAPWRCARMAGSRPDIQLRQPPRAARPGRGLPRRHGATRRAAVVHQSWTTRRSSRASSRISSAPRSSRRSSRPATTRPRPPSCSGSASARCVTASRSSASSEAGPAVRC
jgi:two-component system, NtrC family, response regulator PilR